MNLEQLLPFLETLQITVVKKCPHPGGEVLIFRGTRTFPHNSSPQWFALAMKRGETKVPRKAIEALLRHFWQLQVEIPKSDPEAAQSLGIAPIKLDS